LERAGFQVQATQDPYLALNLIRDHPFELILTDVRMPNLTGIELMQVVKRYQPEIAVVIMTGYTTLDLAIKSLNDGADYFLHKPFDVDNMIWVVNKAIERRRLLRENLRLQTLVNLYKVSEHITAINDSDLLFSQIMKAALSETEAVEGRIYVSKSNAAEAGGYDEFVLPGTSGRIWQQFSVDNIITQLQASRQPVLNSVAAETAPPADNSQATLQNHAGGGTILAVPLKGKDKIRGVLALFKPAGQSFSVADIEVASILASHGGIALENAELLYDRERLFLETIKSLAAALDERDPYTHGHSYRVAALSRQIGRTMGLSLRDLEIIELAGFLHDIGKIGIPDAILLKSSRLTPEEYEIIKTHPEKGANILQHVSRLASIVDGVLSHHERYDGQGYPRRLKGDNIPRAGAIIAVADAFDTLTTDRPYRPRCSREQALNIIREASGTQFHPEVVSALELVYPPNRVAGAHPTIAGMRSQQLLSSSKNTKPRLRMKT
jgi:putative nucleotidyltransferase with HDIG domain